MTAAHREASVVVCPDCRAAVSVNCSWPDGTPRKIPCVSRMRAAERFDGADPASHAGVGEFDRQRPVQLDSGLSQRDITEPLHGREGD